MIRKLVKLKLKDLTNMLSMILNGRINRIQRLKNMFMGGQSSLWIDKL